MNNFDLIEYLNRARSANTPQKLYEVWEQVCRFYDVGKIGKYELEEVKSIVWPSMQELTRLRAEVNSAFVLVNSGSTCDNFSTNLR